MFAGGAPPCTALLKAFSHKEEELGEPHQLRIPSCRLGGLAARGAADAGRPPESLLAAAVQYHESSLERINLPTSMAI